MSLNNNDKVRYLVDVDSLYDTRLSTMVTVFPLFANEYLVSNDYWKRNKDKFETQKDLLDNRLFNTFYKRRNIDILKNAPLTPMAYILSKVINSFYLEANNINAGKELIITINTYPYYLTNDEKKKLGEILYFYLSNSPRIEYVRLPNTELNVNYIKYNDIALVCKYDLLDWIETLDKDEVLETPLLNIKMIGPKILNTDHEEHQSAFKDVFEVMESLYTKIADVEFLDSLYFSASLNPGRENELENFVNLYKKDKNKLTDIIVKDYHNQEKNKTE